MRAVVFHDVGDIRLDNVPEPKVRDDYDAIVRLTVSAICGTDLHFVRGTVGPMKPGTILGHEGVGIVEEVGKGVRNLQKGDRVVIPSTIACGSCSYCRAGWYSKCDNANPKDKEVTAFYGGPEMTGPFDGLQAEYARVPYANVGLVKLPDSVSDDDAILLSDIWPTAYFGVDVAHVEPGKTVAVFGCGPVGQFCIAAALKRGAGRVFAIDTVESRLAMARSQGAEAIDFNADDPVQALKDLTNGIGPDRAIDAVGVDAERAHAGPARKQSDAEARKMEEQLHENLVKGSGAHNGQWRAGDGPSQALIWAVDSIAKGGTVSIIGVYPPTQKQFPIGKAAGKNLTIRMGDCPHRRYLPDAVREVAIGEFRPSKILTQIEPMTDAIEAYKAFDTRKPGWIKVELSPRGDPSRTSTTGEVEIGTLTGR
jgi:threonine dehydrogenase-like Zn-dependent dehydrogenase